MSSRCLTALLLTFALLGTASSLQNPAPPKPDAAPRVDQYGDPLPPGVLARCGSNKLRVSGSVELLAFSPDSKTLAVSRWGVLSLWDTVPVRLRHLIPLGRGSTSVMHAIFSPDSKQLTCMVDGMDAHVLVVNVEDGTVLRRVILERDPGRGGITTAQIAPDGSMLALGRIDWTLRLHDMATGRETARIPLPGGIQKPWELCFSPDGQTIVVFAYEDRVRFFHVATSQWTSGLDVPGAVIRRGAFSPSGKRFAVCSNHNAGDPSKAKVPSVVVWDWATRKLLFQEAAPGPHFTEQLVFSPDDWLLAHDLCNRPTVVRDAATGKVVQEIPVGRPNYRYAFSPNGKLFAAAHLFRVCLWETGTWRNLSVLADPVEQVVQLQFSPDGKLLHGRGNVILSWEAATGKQVRQYPAPDDARLAYSESLSSDAALMAYGGAGTITLRDSSTGKTLHVWQGLKGNVRFTSFTKDGRWLIAFGEEEGVLIYELATKQLLHRLPIPRCAMFALSPDYHWLAVCPMHGEETVEFWDLRNGRRAQTIRTGPVKCNAIAFTPDSRHLVTGGCVWSQDGRLTVTGAILFWDVETGTVSRSCTGPMRGTSSWSGLVLSRDGRTLFSGDTSGKIFLWEVASGQARKEFQGHTMPPQALALSPDERLLASASAEAPVYVWEVRDRQLRPLTVAELDQAWLDLHSNDASQAFTAIQRLAATPALAVPFLRDRLQPVSVVKAERVKELLLHLDSLQFAEREQAATELQQVAEQVLPTLRQALKGQLSPEVRRRLEEIVKQAETATPETLRSLRAVEALEWIGTPEVLPVLDRLATGAPEATLTREAKATVKRLRARK